MAPPDAIDPPLRRRAPRAADARFRFGRNQVLVWYYQILQSGQVQSWMAETARVGHFPLLNATKTMK
jgi:hypothetical protein